MPGPPFKSLQSAAAAPPSFFSLACRVAKLNFCLWLSICNCNWPREKCKLHNTGAELRQIVIVVPPSSARALSYALRQPLHAAGALRFLSLTSATSAERAHERGNQSRATTPTRRCPTRCRLIAASVAFALVGIPRVRRNFILHKCGEGSPVALAALLGQELCMP